MKLLVVDDDAQIAELVRMGFELHWQETQVLGAQNGGDALDLVEREQPDLVLLDVAMPGMDGFEVLQQLREFSDVPVIMLTASDSLVDKVKGLELGADDYVTKPFDHLELLARARALLRRMDMSQPVGRASSFTSRDLSVDFQSRQVRVQGALIALTDIEYKLLYYFVRNAGRVLPYSALLSRVWGREYTDEIHSLRVYIWRLRRKLGDDPERPRYIMTMRGVGYRFGG